MISPGSQDGTEQGKLFEKRKKKGIHILSQTLDRDLTIQCWFFLKGIDQSGANSWISIQENH